MILLDIEADTNAAHKIQNATLTRYLCGETQRQSEVKFLKATQPGKKESVPDLKKNMI